MFIRRIVALYCAAIFSASSLAAQANTDSGQQTVLRGSDAIWFGAFTAGSVALSRFDTRIAYWFRDTAQQNNEAMRQFANTMTQIHETRLTLGALVVYGLGRLTKSATMADIGWHAAESVVAVSVACQIIRGPLGRSRPSRSGLDHPYDFRYLRGFTEFDARAFPSIHASGAFAAATVLVVETSRRNPRANWVVAPISYALAASPSYARMYLAEHWASDIFMGAFMGVLAGDRVVTYSHAHPNNRIDTSMLGQPAEGLTLVPLGRGARIAYSHTF